MASSRTFTLLCGLLAATLVGATLNPPAVLLLGPEVIRESKSWPPRLQHHNAMGQVEQLSKGGRELPMTGGVQDTVGTQV